VVVVLSPWRCGGWDWRPTDLKLVAVLLLITKALIEIPPRFKDLLPVNPVALEKVKISSWTVRCTRKCTNFLGTLVNIALWCKEAYYWPAEAAQGFRSWF
jgi:hypothetical protein